MNCRKCGAMLNEGARFCSQCGTEVKTPEPEVRYCEKCGAALKDVAVFCSQCGSPVTRGPETQAAQEKPEAADEKAAVREFKLCPQCGKKAEADEVYCSGCARLLRLVTISGAELLRMNMMSFYEGEPTVGVAKATGTLVIYDDKIVFEKKMGNSLGGAFGLIGMSIAQKAVRENPVDTYLLSDVENVKESKYMAVMPMIVLTLKSGRVVSFCGTANSAKIGQAAALIGEYMEYNG